MKQTFARLGRLTLISLAAFGVATISNVFNHLKYWKGTIFAVQTVDFNILSHTLPTKLSTLLIQENTKEIQRTLNSNYGLFGMVVTDCQTEQLNCPNQEILYSSKSSYRWKQQLQVDNFQHHPYDMLRDPPPIYVEGHFTSPYLRKRQPTGQTNSGAVIGRVYYIRTKLPTFIEDYKRWIKKPSSFAGANSIYTVTVALLMLAGLFLWIVFELIIYIKNVHEKQLALENDKTLTLKENKLLEAENESTKQRNDLLEAEQQFNKQRNKLLEAENKIARTRGFIGGIQEVIEQDFTSVISNRIQELQGILGRLNTDIANIAHDMRKAPLIKSVEDFSNKRVEELTKLPLSETEKNSILQDIIQYVEDAEQTIKVISWVVNDLDEVAKLEPRPVCLQDELKNFDGKFPPNLRKPWLTIDFPANCEEPLWINCNPWHLRSIVKNALYNSSAALIRHRLVQSTFKGNISVRCVRSGNEAGILVEDNGPGFSEQALEKLYQFVDRKVDENAELTKGKGSTIVFSYLSLHGGRVELENAVGKGAKAMFFFPLICPPSLNN